MELKPKAYQGMSYEVIREADAEMELETRAGMESHIVAEIEQYLNQGGVLN